MRQWLVNIIVVDWIWRIAPHRVKLWAFMNDERKR